MASCLLNPVAMQSKIEEYWAFVYAGDLKGIESVVSEDISVETSVTTDGNEKTEKYTGKDQLLATVGKISGAIHKILKDDRDYKQESFAENSGLALMEVTYIQRLALKGKDDLMEMSSKGTQIWAFNGTKLTSLKVAEVNTIKTGWVDNEGVAPDQLIGPAIAPAKGLSSFSCVLL